MNYCMKFSLFMFVLVAQGCASVQTGPNFVNASEPGAGISLVYVYRPSSPPFLLSPEMKLDDIPITDLPSSSYFHVSVTPGEHLVTSDWHGVSGVADGEIRHTFEPDTVYYVRVANTMSIDGIFLIAGAGYAGSSFSGDISIVSSEKALSEILKCREILLEN